MKKFILIISIGLISSLSFSQTFKSGLIVGFDGARVTGDNKDYYNKLGFMAGGFVSHPLSEKSSLEFDLFFIQKGSHHSPNIDAGDLMTYNLTLNYLELPVIYSFKLPGKFSEKICAEVGSAYGRLLSSSEVNSLGATNSNPFNKNEYSFIVGLKYIISPKIDFNIRFDNTWFFYPIRDHEGGGRYYFNWGQCNSLCSLSLRYNFLKNDKK